MLHFDTIEHLEGWLSSDARKRLLAEIEPYLEGSVQVENTAGLEFWFTPPDSEQKQVKLYKQFLGTWSVTLPLTIFVPWVLLERIAKCYDFTAKWQVRKRICQGG